MSKYQINYSRVAPDHRVPFDYTFVKKIQGPLDYMKHWKQGFMNSWVKYYHIHLCGLSIVLLTGVVVNTFWNTKNDEYLRDKLTKFPAQHFVRQFKNGNTAAYDNILHKLVTDPLGNKDLPFEEY